VKREQANRAYVRILWVRTMQKRITIHDFKEQLEHLIETLQKSHETLFIEQNGEATAAVIPIDEYQHLLAINEPASLEEFVTATQAELERAIEKYDDEKARIKHLRRFRRYLDELWDESQGRTDNFWQILILLKHSYADFEKPSDMTLEHLRILRAATGVLEKPKITPGMRREIFYFLNENDINTMPKIPDLVKLMEKAGI